jgi:hypothetical protein
MKKFSEENKLKAPTIAKFTKLTKGFCDTRDRMAWDAFESLERFSNHEWDTEWVDTYRGTPWR